MLLDRILLIIIFVEVLYTVQVSFRQLRPEPFWVVSLIAVTRRILVVTAELPKMARENAAIFQNAMIELGLLTVLIVALVISLHFLRPDDPDLAAQDQSNQRSARRPTDSRVR